MQIRIRKLENTENEYFAYAKSLCGKATFCLYFTDGIWGSVLLYHFTEMLRSYFGVKKVEFTISENALSLKNEFVLKCLRENSAPPSVAPEGEATKKRQSVDT